MTPKQRFYVFIQNGVGAAVANAVINGAIGWAVVRGFVMFPVWSFPGVVSDLAATVFGVSFGTCLSVPFAARLDMRRGKLAPLVPSPALATWIARLPAGTFKRAFIAGGLSLAVLMPLVALAMIKASAFTPHGYIALKAVLSAVQGTIVTPPVALVALAEGLPPVPVTPTVLTAEGER